MIGYSYMTFKYNLILTFVGGVVKHHQFFISLEMSDEPFFIW